MKINGASLTAIRERSGLSQTDLATESGVSQGRISELEAGDMNVRPGTANALAKALEIPVVAILKSEVAA